MAIVHKILIALCTITFAFSEILITSNGPCPNVLTQSNFNESKFSGKWFEIKSYPNSLIKNDCGRPNYTYKYINYTVSYPTKNVTNGLINNKTLVLKKQFLQNPGKYDVYVNGQKESIPHYVVSTDYKNYSIVWGCTYKNYHNTQRLFIYSRSNSLNPNLFNNTIRPILFQNKLNVTLLRDIVQDNRKCGNL